MKYILFTILFVSSNVLLGYNIVVLKDTAPEIAKEYLFSLPEKVEDGTPLIEFLETEVQISRIDIMQPYLNKESAEFNIVAMRKRMEASVCMNSKKKYWNYAPYTRGVIYWKDGRAAPFTMYLAGITIGEHIFAIPPVRTTD